MARQTQIARGSHLLTSDIDPRQGLFSESQAPASTMNPIARKLNPTSSASTRQRCSIRFGCVAKDERSSRPSSVALNLLVLVRSPGTG
jgi:hypothetical protein